MVWCIRHNLVPTWVFWPHPLHLPTEPLRFLLNSIPLWHGLWQSLYIEILLILISWTFLIKFSSGNVSFMTSQAKISVLYSFIFCFNIASGKKFVLFTIVGEGWASLPSSGTLVFLTLVLHVLTTLFHSFFLMQLLVFIFLSLYVYFHFFEFINDYTLQSYPTCVSPFTLHQWRLPLWGHHSFSNILDSLPGIPILGSNIFFSKHFWTVLS